VNSFQATQFRIWATKTLREFIIKGFVLDDERLKQGKRVFGKDYFDELLERIREIRASERRFYQKITALRTLRGLQRRRTGDEGVLRLRAEQTALGHHRADGGGTDLLCRRCDEAHDGAGDVEARTGRKDSEIGCDGGEELPERGACEGVEPHHLRLDLAENRALGDPAHFVDDRIEGALVVDGSAHEFGLPG